MIINHNINNLSGGVSTQPMEARFDNQVDEMVNFVPTVTNGLRRRNPLKLIGTTVANHTSDMAIHSYDRGDGTNRFGITLNANGLKVYKDDGTNISVATIGSTNPITKWAGTNWKRDIRFLTVGDTTWILNRNMSVKMTSKTTPTYSSNRAFYWIKRSFDASTSGIAGYTYFVTLDGTKYSANHEDSEVAISTLASAISSAGYTTKVSGSVLLITSATSFTFDFGDSWGDQAGIGWTNSVSKLSDLPPEMSGFSQNDVGIIEVTGNDRDNFSNYYLTWTGTKWIETSKGGLLCEFDTTTLPAKLIQKSDGTFQFGFVGSGFEYGDDAWEERNRGDDVSNPIPSFVGRKVSNMFFFKNRLGFTSDESVILSEAGEYYNFWATTAMEILDNDAIDVTIDSNTVSNIRNVNSVAGALTLWADDAQFVLSGGEILSPATTRVSQTSSYSCSNEIQPVVIDNEIVFFNKIGSTMDVMTYAPASINTDSSTAESISAHCSGYIPSTITRAVVSSASNVMFLLDSSNDKIIYCYRYHVNNAKKVMSSWFKLEFGVSIKDISILNNTLFILCGTNQICSMDLDLKDINDTDYLDFGTTEYVSSVILSDFNVDTQQGTRVIREKFYPKNIKVNCNGKVDLGIINQERNSTKKIDAKHIGRKLFIGGTTDKVKIGFSTSRNTGCQIDAISIEGLMKIRSRNV